jgi:hypothetical protein
MVISGVIQTAHLSLMNLTFVLLLASIYTICTFWNCPKKVHSGYCMFCPGYNMQYDLPFNQYFHACNENQAHEFSEFPQNLVYTHSLVWQFLF